MAVHQLPAESGAFARYLRDLTTLLDPGGGWYGVFAQRDPAGMRACLDGVEIPPWDVVDSLLQDFAAGRDGEAVARESARARALHAASAAVHDRRPGGGEALAERLKLMLHEQAQAAGRAEELVRLLRAAPEGSAGARQLAVDLAWVRDDHARASARCAELRARLAALTTPGREPGGSRAVAPEGWFRPEEQAAPWQGRSADRQVPRWAEGRDGGRAGTYGEARAYAEARPSGEAGAYAEAAAPVRTPAPTAAAPEPPAVTEQPEQPEPSWKKARAAAPKRRPRGARFAGLDVDDDEPLASPPLPETPSAAPGAPRGARFGGAPVAAPAPAVEAAHSAADRAAAAEVVAALIRLRKEGRSGEAHVVLCEAAGRPPGQLPLLAGELHRAGLGADWAELLWEASSLPPAQLAAAAGALAGAGRDGDCAQLLRQGASRPAEEIADAVLALGEVGRAPEAQALLSAFVQSRTPEDAALIAAPDPRRLVPQLLDAARAVSSARERDLVHALRIAGIPAA